MSNITSIIKSLVNVKLSSIYVNMAGNAEFAVKLEKNQIAIIDFDTLDSAKSVLYHFDVNSCTCKPINFNPVFAHCETPKVWDAIKSEFYHCELIALDRLIKKYSEINSDMIAASIDDVDEQSIAQYTFKEINRRASIARNMLAGFAGIRNVFIEAIVSTLTSVEKIPAELTSALIAVKNEVDSLNKSAREGDKDSQPNLKNLRNALNSFCNALFCKSPELGMIDEWIFNASHALSADVYQRAYNGRVYNQYGNVIGAFASIEELGREIILACIEELQRKALAQTIQNETIK